VTNITVSSSSSSSVLAVEEQVSEEVLATPLEPSCNNSHESLDVNASALDSRVHTCKEKTPESYKRKVRTRACRLFNSSILKELPESPTYSRAVKRHLFRKMKKTIITEQGILQDCVTCKAVAEIRSKGLITAAMKMEKYRALKQYTQWRREAAKFTGVKLSSFCKAVNLKRTVLLRLIKGAWINKTHAKRLSKQDLRALHTFYKREDNSNEVPFQRHRKKRYMKYTLHEAYKKYIKECATAGRRIISFSLFANRRPKNIRVVSQLPDQGCGCQQCMNCQLKIRSLAHNHVKGLGASLTSNVLETICVPPGMTENDEYGILDCKLKCIHRECEWCGVYKMKLKLDLENTDIDEAQQELSYYQWERVEMTTKKGFKKMKVGRVAKKTTMRDLAQIFVHSLKDMSSHLFNLKFQHQEFVRCKDSLQTGDVLIVCDFATNFSHAEQEEAQGAHWNRKQTTVHPIVCYFVCEECSVGIVCDEIFIASDDLTHDFHAVAAFEEQVVRHLKTTMDVKRIFRFTDNCAGQYKSKNVMDWISRQTIPYSANFFCSKHGKGPSDGVAGRCTQMLSQGKKLGTAESVCNAETMISFFAAQFQLFRHQTQSEDRMCSHKRRHFFAVNDINRELNTDKAKAIKMTRRLHTFRNTGVPGVIETRLNSCCCPTCKDNKEGECLNARHVQKFCRVNIYGPHQENEDIRSFENVHWGNQSVDLTLRASCFDNSEQKRSRKPQKKGSKKKPVKRKILKNSRAQGRGGPHKPKSNTNPTTLSANEGSGGPVEEAISFDFSEEPPGTMEDEFRTDVSPPINDQSTNELPRCEETTDSQPAVDNEKDFNDTDDTTSPIKAEGNSRPRVSHEKSPFPITGEFSEKTLSREEASSSLTADVNTTMNRDDTSSVIPTEVECGSLSPKKHKRKMSFNAEQDWSEDMPLNEEVGRRFMPIRKASAKARLCTPCSVPMKQLPLSILRRGHCNVKTSKAYKRFSLQMKIDNSTDSDSFDEDDIPLACTKGAARTRPNILQSERFIDGQFVEKGAARTRPWMEKELFQENQCTCARLCIITPTETLLQVDGAFDDVSEGPHLRSRNKKCFKVFLATSTKCEGLGLFAAEDIPCGVSLCEYEGKLISSKDISSKHWKKAKFPPDIDEWTGQLSKGCFAFFFQTLDGDTWCIDAEHTFSYGKWINHSKLQFNLKPYVCEKKKKAPRLFFKSIRDISAREELFYDYGEEEEEAVNAHPWLRH